MAVRIDISDLPRAALLKALYDAAEVDDALAAHMSRRRPDQPDFGQPMTPARAEELTRHCSSFGSVDGRWVRVDLAGNFMLVQLYDLDNGEGSAERVVAAVRDQHAINMSHWVDIQDLDPGLVLMTLHRAAHLAPGVAAALARCSLGSLGSDLTLGEAQTLMRHQSRFPFLGGRELKLVFTSRKWLDPSGYDSLYGEGKCAALVLGLKRGELAAEVVPRVCEGVITAVLSDWQLATPEEYQSRRVVATCEARNSGITHSLRIGVGLVAGQTDNFWLRVMDPELSARIPPGNAYIQAVGNAINCRDSRDAIAKFVQTGLSPGELVGRFDTTSYDIEKIARSIPQPSVSYRDDRYTPQRRQIDELLELLADGEACHMSRLTARRILTDWCERDPQVRLWASSPQAELDGLNPLRAIDGGHWATTVQMLATTVFDR